MVGTTFACISIDISVAVFSFEVAGHLPYGRVHDAFLTKEVFHVVAWGEVQLFPSCVLAEGVFFAFWEGYFVGTWAKGSFVEVFIVVAALFQIFFLLALIFIIVSATLIGNTISEREFWRILGNVGQTGCVFVEIVGHIFLFFRYLFTHVASSHLLIDSLLNFVGSRSWDLILLIGCI